MKSNILVLGWMMCGWIGNTKYIEEDGESQVSGIVILSEHSGISLVVYYHVGFVVSAILSLLPSLELAQ